MKYESYQEKNCGSAEEFWDVLSPQKPLRTDPSKFIYRGQRDASWGLMPSILRQDDKNLSRRIFGSLGVNCDDQVFSELRILEHFAEQCDSLGLIIPKDSVEFREKHLNTDAADKYLLRPEEWPNDQLFEVMALAQHHGIPTRFLDWSKRSYVAAYFAASSALDNKENWKGGELLAVWAFDIEYKNLYRNIAVVNVPGSASQNMASQAGIFTLHKQPGNRGEPFVPISMEVEFGKLHETHLFKITTPVSESKKILELCNLYGVTASTLFPSFDGAARAVLDSINCWDKTESL